MRPETILVKKVIELYEVEYELITVQHPEGVKCAFTDNQCTCGKLDIGVVNP